MSKIMRGSIPKLIVILCGALMIIDGFFNVPAFIHTSAVTLQKFVMIISAFAIGIGVASVLMHNGREITKQVKGKWYFSIWLLIIFFIFTGTGFAYGSTSDQYMWLFNSIFTPVNQTLYSLLGVFIVYALYRTFQARNVEVGIMLVIALFTMMGSAPIGGYLWSGFPAIREWCKTLNLGGSRGFIIVAAIGAVAMGLRVLLGRETAAFGGAE